MPAHHHCGTLEEKTALSPATWARRRPTRSSFQAAAVTRQRPSISQYLTLWRPTGRTADDRHREVLDIVRKYSYLMRPIESKVGTQKNERKHQPKAARQIIFPLISYGIDPKQDIRLLYCGFLVYSSFLSKWEHMHPLPVIRNQLGWRERDPQEDGDGWTKMHSSRASIFLTWVSPYGSKHSKRETDLDTVIVSLTWSLCGHVTDDSAVRERVTWPMRLTHPCVCFCHLLTKLVTMVWIEIFKLCDVARPKYSYCYHVFPTRACSILLLLNCNYVLYNVCEGSHSSRSWYLADLMHWHWTFHHLILEAH